MAEIVNLRRARKAKARAAAAEAAAADRIRFGRSREEREVQERASHLDRRRLDGHLRDPVTDVLRPPDDAKKP
jgi:hypothetical protein